MDSTAAAQDVSKAKQITDFTIVLALVAILMVGMALSFMFLFPPEPGPVQ
ncbi:hypothetical protein [Antrihabitans sp. YC2-6]|nr:hypothetical protein [Antrihabitans sp. YC2-6]MBJ8347749.1 hypothetical protein [Antrihabitans sp. YC2-6]